MSATTERLDVTAEIPVAEVVVASERVPASRAAVLRRAPHGAVIFTAVALFISAVGVLYLMQTSRVASLGYQASALQRQRDAQALANEQLSFDIAHYESLPLIERVARDQLGMQPMSDYQFLDVQLPAATDLPQPTPEAQPAPSLATRVWRRLTGRGVAQHAEADQ